MDEDSPSAAQGQPSLSPLSHTGPARPTSASTTASTPNHIVPPPPRSAGAGSGTPASGGAAQGDSSSNNTSAGTPSAPSSALPAAASSKRRRGLGVVTPNACTECRKKRAKVRTFYFLDVASSLISQRILCGTPPPKCHTIYQVSSHICHYRYVACVRTQPLAPYPANIFSRPPVRWPKAMWSVQGAEGRRLYI